MSTPVGFIRRACNACGCGQCFRGLRNGGGDDDDEGSELVAYSQVSADSPPNPNASRYGTHHCGRRRRRRRPRHHFDDDAPSDYSDYSDTDSDDDGSESDDGSGDSGSTPPPPPGTILERIAARAARAAGRAAGRQSKSSSPRKGGVEFPPHQLISGNFIIPGSEMEQAISLSMQLDGIGTPQDQKECVICMDVFTRDNPEMHTLCSCGANKSAFHYTCLLLWTETEGNKHCPMCRGELFFEEMRGP